jgi:hypothetical protein
MKWGIHKLNDITSCQPGKVFTMADDPHGQHGSRAFRRIEREAKNIDRPETIVTPWFYLVGIGTCE